MTLEEALRRLESCGTERNRKIYLRHGVKEPSFGVSFANLRTLHKTIKMDHALARQLWTTGNHDARVLATLIADPTRADRALLQAWARDLDNCVVTDAFTGFASRTPLAGRQMEAWQRSAGEWTGRAGWHLLAQLIRTGRSPSDADLSGRLSLIERRIHKAKNRVREAMNGALIAIGGRGGALQKKALAAAARIGKVQVDHGETGCKTPDAAEYIKKMARRRLA